MDSNSPTSVSTLVNSAITDAQSLVRQQIELAKAEVTQSAKQAANRAVQTAARVAPATDVPPAATEPVHSCAVVDRVAPVIVTEPTASAPENTTAVDVWVAPAIRGRSEPSYTTTEGAIGAAFDQIAGLPSMQSRAVKMRVLA